MNTKSILISVVFTSIVFSSVAAPFRARADGGPVISEIAWMGTSASANAEWIELFNPLSAAVSVDGWTLSAADGSPGISLAGSVPAGGYFILERTNDESLPGIQAGQIYSGSLSNSGERMILKDRLGRTVDEVDGSSGWPAGDNLTKQTMQRSGSVWVTSDPTPGAPVSVSGSEEERADPTASGTSTVAASGKASGPDDDADPGTIAIKPDPRYSARMVVPDYESAGAVVPLVALVRQDGKKDMVSGRFVWSTGDGKQYSRNQNGRLSHVFKYPGDYVVTLAYYSDPIKDEPDSIHQKTVHIVPGKVSVSGITDDGGVILENESTHDIDLYGWEIRLNGFLYLFPRYTIVRKGSKLSVSSETVGFAVSEPDRVELLNPSQSSAGSKGF